MDTTTMGTSTQDRHIGPGTQLLNGCWLLAVDPDNQGRRERWFEQVHPSAREAPVPGVIQQVFPGYHGVAWYWHVFRLRPNATWPVTDGYRLLLRFGAVDYLAEVWINGSPVGSHEGGETPFDLDVTDAVRDGDNLLTVRVLNPTTTPIDGYVLGQIPHRNRRVPFKPGASLNCGGIPYPVELLLAPPVRVSDVFARPDAATGTISVTVTVWNGWPAATEGSIALRVAPAAGGETTATVAQPARLPPGESEHELAVYVPDVRLWDLDDPFLYRVTISVAAGEQPPHRHSIRCGFRDFRLVDGYFHLNGRRIFLKSTHTGNCVPIGQQAPALRDLARRDIVFAKASGFNMVRFIAGMAYPEQLDFCDEIGIMVYEECLAAWLLEDSPRMAERFDHSTSAMVLRDRNHPSVTVWGLLNETQDDPTFRRAVEFLPELRQLDPTRLVLLSSGRWDKQPAIGSASNPGGREWEPVWGDEGRADGAIGDVHYYPRVPQTAEANERLRGLGRDVKPVFLSEYGIGSLMNVIGEARHFEQAGARPDLEDAAMIRAQSEGFCADWQRLGFDDVYPFPEDFLRESQRLHARQRTLGFDLIRANPRICGFNLTGMLDHGITGEGLWTYWREWKPGTFDAVADGWSPLRWCLFVEPLHGYLGREVTLKAVLANEGVLGPGEYPTRFRIFGPDGVAWERSVTLRIPDPAALATPAFCETIRLDGPAGRYQFAASLERGGAPTGGRLGFYMSDPAVLPGATGDITLCGIDRKAEAWLTECGLSCHPFETGASGKGEVILVGKLTETERTPELWGELRRRMLRGSQLLCVSPSVFARGDDGTYWLPLANKGQCYTFNDWLYHKECVAKRHPVFEGLQAPGIMDWDYYGPVIPHEVFEGLDTPDETIAAAFATGHNRYPNGYGSSLLIAAYRMGKGRLILSTPYLLENLDTHPAADRMLLNLIRFAQAEEVIAPPATDAKQEGWPS